MKQMRSLGTVLGLSYRADPLRSTGVFLATSSYAAGVVLFSLTLKLIADGVASRNVGAALSGAITLGLVLVISETANWLASSWSVTLEEKTGFEIDLRLIELSSSLPGVEHHERSDFVKEMEILREQRWQLSRVIGAVVGGLSSVVQIGTSAALLATIHPALLFLPAFAVPSMFLARKAEVFRQATLEKNADAARMSNHLRNLALSAEAGKEIRVFGLGKEIENRFKTLWHSIVRNRRTADYRAAMMAAGGWAIFALGYAASVWFTVTRALVREATPGDVLLVLHLAGQVNEQVSTAVFTMNSAFSSLKAIGRYLWLRDYAEDHRWSAEQPASSPPSLTKGIHLRGVCFTYPETEHSILEDVDLFLPAGSTVAVVGENGAGKTTLIKLLCGFYAPSVGEILVDGIPIRNFDPEEWRRVTSAAFQDFVQFYFLARETVGVGDLPSIEQTDDVLGALRRAHAEDVVQSLPAGLETQLGKIFSGAELSGGQWQKLALGRSMMRRKPLILFLDEPTASLDAQTEHALFERYAEAARDVSISNGAITILVSHRFSTVRMADLIVVLHEGRVIEMGTHEELVELQGHYQEMFELQARGYR